MCIYVYIEEVRSIVIRGKCYQFDKIYIYNINENNNKIIIIIIYRFVMP
jgi:hypothetical protein